MYYKHMNGTRKSLKARILVGQFSNLYIFLKNLLNILIGHSLNVIVSFKTLHILLKSHQQKCGFGGDK